MTQPASDKPTPKAKLGCIGCFGLIVIAGIFGAIFNKGAKPPAAERERPAAAARKQTGMEKRGEAYYYAREFIKKQLKAPSTAKFPGIVMDSSDIHVTLLPTGGYRVSTWVDAQNAFGAMLRKYWLCEVNETDDGKAWRVIGACGLIE